MLGAEIVDRLLAVRRPRQCGGLAGGGRRSGRARQAREDAGRHLRRADWPSAASWLRPSAFRASSSSACRPERQGPVHAGGGEGVLKRLRPRRQVGLASRVTSRSGAGVHAYQPPRAVSIDAGGEVRVHQRWACRRPGNTLTNGRGPVRSRRAARFPGQDRLAEGPLFIDATTIADDVEVAVGADAGAVGPVDVQAQRRFTGHQNRAASRAAKARARWRTASLAAGSISPNVSAWPSGMKIGIVAEASPCRRAKREAEAAVDAALHHGHRPLGPGHGQGADEPGVEVVGELVRPAAFPPGPWRGRSRAAARPSGRSGRRAPRRGRRRTGRSRRPGRSGRWRRRPPGP